jgi:acetylornithine deacetylase/succinyl-diaminopimelate desuccinylase family protein
MSKTQLLAAIDNDRAELVDFLRQLVRAPSPNPPGDTRAAADVVRSFLAGRDIEATVIAPRAEMPNVVSEFEGNAPGERLILNGHLDVFPVGDAEGWDRDPWSGDLDDGNVHGRGTCDMKAGTAASVIAFTYLHRVRDRLRGSLGLTAVSDEETGGRFGSRWLLENDTRWLGDCVLNAEPSGLGTIRFAEKGTLRLTFTIRTAGAHGAYVHRTESATRLAAALIDRLASIEKLDPDLPANLVDYLAQAQVGAAIDAAMGDGASDIVVKPTLNIGTIQGGLKVNMIPDTCRFEADIRLPIGLKADRVIQTVENILRDFPQAELSMQEAASNPSSFCAHDHRMVDVLASNVAAITGKRPLAAPSLGATDCKFWRYRDVPAYVFGPAPGRMAMTNESVPINEFMTVVKAHVVSAWEYLGGGD